MFESAGIREVLRNDQLEQLEEIFYRAPVLRKSLEVGAWICGGFPRALLLGRSIDDYLDPSKLSDIDVFFPSNDVMTLILQTDLFLGAERSTGGFAVQKYFPPIKNQIGREGEVLPSGNFNLGFKVQLINKPSMIKSSLFETLETFDFVNCQVAIVGDRIYYPIGWRELEESRLIRINHASSPFMGSRLTKYLNYRGSVGITEDSYDLLTEWLCRAGNDQFENHSLMHLFGVENSVRELRRKGLVSRENLIFFLNKWLEVVKVNGDSYSDFVQIDWAASEIARQPV